MLLYRLVLEKNEVIVGHIVAFSILWGEDVIRKKNSMSCLFYHLT